jgi:aarF domain-containing kinase
MESPSSTKTSAFHQIHLLTVFPYRALPILRQLGAQSSGSILKSGDLSMVKVWAGLEARKFLQASIESVEACVKYDQLSPNF